MRAIIVDDEPKAREVLQRLLSHYAPEIEVVGNAKNITEGRALIDNEEPDVVFLDVEMPNGSGFDLIRSIDNPTFETVFTTAYERYAIEAFRVAAVDYLVKPIDPEELLACTKRLRTRQNRDEDEKSQLKSLLEQLASPGNKKLALPDTNGVTFVNPSQIIRCSSDRNYTLVHCSDGERHLICKTLKEFETTLTPFNFFRVHHSDLINLDYVARFEKADGGYAVMSDDSKIAVSKRKRAAFLEVLGL